MSAPCDSKAPALDELFREAGMCRQGKDVQDLYGKVEAMTYRHLPLRTERAGDA